MGEVFPTHQFPAASTLRQAQDEGSDPKPIRRRGPRKGDPSASKPPPFALSPSKGEAPHAPNFPAAFTLRHAQDEGSLLKPLLLSPTKGEPTTLKPSPFTLRLSNGQASTRKHPSFTLSLSKGEASPATSTVPLAQDEASTATNSPAASTLRQAQDEGSTLKAIHRGPRKGDPSASKPPPFAQSAPKGEGLLASVTVSNVAQKAKPRPARPCQRPVA